MEYDVLVLGGGIIGCSVAYELSKYNLNIALIERDYDVIDDISSINSSIIYDGSETKDDITAYLEKEGIKLIEEACMKFNIKYEKVGAIRIANNAEEIKELNNMYTLALSRGISDISLINKEELIRLNKGLNKDISKALYSKEVTSINPYELAIAYGEVAVDNGVNFKFQEEVINVEEFSKKFLVTTNKNKLKCKIVIDTIIKGFYSKNEDNTKEKKDKEYITYFMIDKEAGNEINNIIIKKYKEAMVCFNISYGKDIFFGLVKSNRSINRSEVVNYCSEILPNINEKNIINIFSEEYEDSMIIDYKDMDKGYIKVTGNNYSKMTLAPAISKIISEAISKQLKVNYKKDFIDKRREVFRFRDMSREEVNEVVKIDKRYGKIICICNQVTEGEIVDCIRRPLGARTVEGIRKRTGAGLGPCYGAYCSRKIIKILAKELDIKPSDVIKDSANSKFWLNRIKEFEEV